MGSSWEREQLSGIERWFETEDPGFARSLRDAVLPHRRQRGALCLVADLAGTALFVASVVLASFPLLLASAAVVVTALAAHILWPPTSRL
ncbi:DUF3040 domain-containing protein [Amycolatopsis taiwanensis]|uniref:DUF3040 domain-containing protein n=1 Tax=Amycolatopsis taiwanensis TaxID=342230 RepID=UPI0004B5B435|nr:DUF3040 domain-containing protein [Amycolatopsis taiwanensis]